MQKAVIVSGSAIGTGELNFTSSLGALNSLLADGWTVVSATPIGVSVGPSAGSANRYTGGAVAATLVILTKAEPTARRRK